MNYKFEGKVKLILDEQTFNGGFSKREIVVTALDEDKFAPDIKFEFHKNDAKTLDKFKVGDEVVVMFSLRGNEYNGKYYVNVIGGDIIKKRKTKTTNSAPAPEDGDDLPF